jgi:hypothetical protein
VRPLYEVDTDAIMVAEAHAVLAGALPRPYTPALLQSGRHADMVDCLELGEFTFHHKIALGGTEQVGITQGGAQQVAPIVCAVLVWATAILVEVAGHEEKWLGKSVRSRIQSLACALMAS